MIIPELPDFLTQLGGADKKGFIISLFTFSAALSRPFSGKLADTIGRVPVMVVGVTVSMICGLLYPFFASVSLFFILRFAHGFSTGFKPTGTTAYLADIVPVHKRGQAMGILGVAASSGMALGPAIGSYIAYYFSLNIMFFASSFMAFVSLLTIAFMQETLLVKQKLDWSFFKISINDFFDPLVKLPAVVMILTAYSFGIILTIVPDLCAYTGVQNKGTFFLVFVFSSIIMRLIACSLSDKIGRKKALFVGCLVLIFGMYFMGVVNSAVDLYIGAFLLGLAAGINSPVIFAWTIDLANSNHRARAMATVYVAMEIGIGLGAFVSGWVYGNDPIMFRAVFWIGAVMAMLAFSVLSLFD